MRYFFDNNTLFIRGTFRAASTGDFWWFGFGFNYNQPNRSHSLES